MNHVVSRRVPGAALLSLSLVALAVSGDTIDMRGLTCSAITLSSGAIVIPQASLRLLGPGYTKLSINGSGDRVLKHQGTGLLRLTNLSVANGALTTPYAPEMSGKSANGGCIYTAG